MAFRLFFLWCFFGVGSLFGQDRYLVYLSDKQEYSECQLAKQFTEKALVRRAKHQIGFHFTDYPVSDSYIKELARYGEIRKKSKWLNAAIVSTDQPDSISKLSFVEKVEEIQTTYHHTTQTTAITQHAYGNNEEGYAMMDIPFMHQLGFVGKGVRIAIFDSGFSGVNVVKYFQQSNILWTYDVVGNETDVYNDTKHGTYVFSTLGAYSPGELVGVAYGADYFLFRTEDENSESREEEFNWLVAAEKADSLGVDIISSSVGYNTFDNPAENYVYNDLDGKTSIITQAASWASRKGILVVTSAGNEGNNPWKHIIFPADADSVLTVGAVDTQGEYLSFSSIGPTADGRIKPDVVCLGTGVTVADPSGVTSASSGTSFAVPQLAGFCAGVLSAKSSLTNHEVIKLVRDAGTNSSSPNNEIGYGVPQFSLIIDNLFNNGENGVLVRSLEVFPNPINDQPLSFLLDDIVDLNQEAEIELHHNSGAVIHHEKVVIHSLITPLSLDTKTLNKGIYVLRIVLKSGVYSHKIIKM